MLAGDRHALVQLVRCGVRHYGRNLCNVLAAVFEDSDNLVIEPGFLDRTAAVDKQNVLAVVCKLRFKIAEGVLTEIELGRVVVAETS